MAPTAASRQREIVTVYAAGLFQGLSLVAVPAAATVLTSSSGYDLSASEYGLLFLPQVILAIVGATTLPSLAGRVGLKRVLLAGLAADTVAMTLLVLSNTVQGDAAAFPMLLVATGSLGLGFGLTLGSISIYAGAFQPERREVALTALNVLLGLGTALSPLLIAVFLDYGEWWYLPLGAAVGLAVVFVMTWAQPLVIEQASAERSARPPVPALFWVFAAALVVYGVAETMFGNWGTTLLVDDGVAATSATYALAAFWAAVTAGRLVIALVSGRLRSTRIYVVLPWLIALALLLAPAADTAAGGIALFAFAGLACSGFFPMTIGYGETRFPAMVEVAAGWLIAAYQIGYGLAAFGGGALQEAVSLTTIYRVAAVLAFGMGVLALVISRQQRPVTARV
jgi:MFS transporter, FHS family, glucose/mannose:H+ symporter